MTFFRRLLATNARIAVILVHLLVGGVFLSEGVQKFLFSEALGVGRFAKIGIPAPEAMARSSGSVRSCAAGGFSWGCSLASPPSP
jgi:hypothetical protein